MFIYKYKVLLNPENELHPKFIFFIKCKKTKHLSLTKQLILKNVNSLIIKTEL